MSAQNEINKRQTEALKLEALRLYFDFTDGRPTYDQVAQKLKVAPRTVQYWLADNENAKMLDEIVPLWPNIGSARQYASGHVQEALETVVSVMRKSKNDKTRMDAAMFLLSLAGVRPSDGESDEEKGSEEGKRPAVLLNLFLGGGQEPIQIIDGEARELARNIRVEPSPQLPEPE